MKKSFRNKSETRAVFWQNFRVGKASKYYLLSWITVNKHWNNKFRVFYKRKTMFLTNRWIETIRKFTPKKNGEVKILRSNMQPYFDQFVWPNTIHTAKTLICRLSSFICIKNVVLLINVAMPDRIVNMTDSSNLCPNFDILLSSLKASVWKYRNVDTNWMSPSCLLLLFA